MAKKKINFSQDDIIDALEQFALNKNLLSKGEKLDTIEYHYDDNNNVLSVDGIQQ